MNIQTFNQQSIFTKAITDFVIAFCHNQKTPINMALSGGKAPQPIYTALANRPDFDLKKITFFQVDERAVPKNHPESNYRLITESLFKNNVDPKTLNDDIRNRPPCTQGGKGGVDKFLPLAKGEVRRGSRIDTKSNKTYFHHFNTSLPIKEALSTYEKTLKQKVPTGFDLTILGLGSDGHTASLFPNSSALHEQKKLTAHTQTTEFAIKDRLTITFPLILKSKNILLLIPGINKKTILDDLLHGSKSIDELPAKALLNHKNLQIFYGNF